MTDEKKQMFLDAFERTGIITDACLEAGIHHSTYRRWLGDAEFAEAVRYAQEAAADALESEARRRAIEGVTRKRYNKDGDLISEEIVYSDSLMALLLKANKPEKFAERSKTEITSPDDAFKPADTTQAAARLASILEEARLRKERGETFDPNDDLFS